MAEVAVLSTRGSGEIEEVRNPHAVENLNRQLTRSGRHRLTSFLIPLTQDPRKSTVSRHENLTFGDNVCADPDNCVPLAEVCVSVRTVLVEIQAGNMDAACRLWVSF